jgi:uncharacterized protein (DUF433 family)
VGGEPRIEGTRIRVSDIVARQREGRSPAEIASDRCYPHLSLAQVYSALAYYEDHRDEIEGDFHAADEFAERMKRENPKLVRDLAPKAGIPRFGSCAGLLTIVNEDDEHLKDFQDCMP